MRVTRGKKERSIGPKKKYASTFPKEVIFLFYGTQFIANVERTINERWMTVLRHAEPREVLERYRALKKRRVARWCSIRVDGCLRATCLH